MWVLKLKLNSEKMTLGKLAIKHKVSMTGYPLSHYRKGNFIYDIAAGFLFGEEKNIKALLKDIKKDPNIIKIESKDNFLMVVLREHSFFEVVHDPRIIRPEPTIINKDGYHIWSLACFERKPLVRVLKMAEKKLDAEVLKFKEEKLDNISITKALPSLTKKQKKALEIAINGGYYEYPKKIKMEQLANRMGISYSTFQAHLKKAEGKIIPEIFRKL